MAASRPPYTIKVAATKDEIEACYDIRVEGGSGLLDLDPITDAVRVVFVVEQGYPHDTEIDDLDPISTHFLLSVQAPSPPPSSTAVLGTILSSSNESTSTPIGTIRYTPSKSKLGRLALSAEYRKYGFGRILVDALENHVKGGADGKVGDLVQEKEGKRVIDIRANAQVPVIPFYEKCGYRPVGEEFLEEGEPHKLVIKTVNMD
ncbi:hypothetical protein P7C73_g281, partial [Tremellales sp. Uapishka_1]